MSYTGVARFFDHQQLNRKSSYWFDPVKLCSFEGIYQAKSL